MWGLLLEYGISEVSIERLGIHQVLSSLVELELQYLPNTCSLWNLCLAVSLPAALLHQKFHSLTLWIHSTKVSQGFEQNFCTEFWGVFFCLTSSRLVTNLPKASWFNCPEFWSPFFSPKHKLYFLLELSFSGEIKCEWGTHVLCFLSLQDCSSVEVIV